MALRNAVESPEEVTSLRDRVAQLEKDKGELNEKLRTITGELDGFKAAVNSKGSELMEAAKKLNEVTKAKEHAERTVADYEFIVEDLKRRNNEQKEDLHSKIISLEGEMESYRAQIRSQELELSANENLNLLNQVAEISAKSEVLQTEVKELERMVKERETALKNEEESRSKQYHELETRCKEAESSMNKSIGEVESLKKQLEAALNDLTVLREIQTGSEMELIELKDQLKNATEESETSRAKEADLREKFEDVQCALKEKSQLLEQAHKNSVEMSSKIAELKEELDAEKLARDVSGRELEQLREENNLIAAVAKEAKSALSDAQSQVEEANKRCEEQAQRHEEEVALRVSELQSVLDAHSSEKAAFARELGEYQKKLDEMTKKLEQMAETITALEKEAAELREQKKNLSSELELGIQVYEEKVAELDQIAKLITDKEEEIAQLSEAKKDLLEEIQLVKHSLEEKVDEIEKLKAASAAFTESAALLESERDSLKSDLAATQEKLCESEKELKRLESMGSEIAVITSERDGLQDRLNAAEELITKFREEEAQIRAALEQSQAQIAALTAQKTLLEEDFQAKESEYKEKLAASDMTITELNAVVEKLGLERNQLSERLSATQQELTAKETAAKSLVTLERVNISLKSEMNALETELEAAKQQHQAEIGVAQEVVESSNEEVAELKRALLLKEAYAENLAKKCDKLAETETELTQQISDLCEERNQLKAQMNEGVRMLAPDHTIDHNESPSKDAQQKIEALEREIDILKMEKQQLEKIANYSSCNEVGELKRYLAIKDDYIEYLGKQCDEFDDIEAKYREEIADLCKERDRLKAQIDPSSVPVVPVLTEALTNGIKMLTPDHPKTRKEVLSEESEQKIHELQALVKKLEEEKKQLIKQKSQDDKVIQQSAEQRELCEQKKMKDAEQKIEALEREVDILKVEKQQLEKIANYSSCNEVGELKRYLAIKDDYIEYLGKQCDEFDDIEAKYKEEIADLCKERDRLKAQIDPSSVPVVPVLTEGLTNGIKMLTPDHPRTHKQDSSEEAERKVLELEALVEKLEEEKKQFSRISNQVNETAELKSRVAELLKENAALRSQCTSEASKPCLPDAHGKRLCEEEEMNERSDKDDAFTSAPSSPTLQSRSYDSFAGPAHEESTIETAAVTPNRTLHTTLYKRIDKTTNLLETSDATKRENSRCAQQ
ncbi:M protein repeat protein [Necator americanus]|uniref:M protein repeat protein n=1 Tax=Necator americanus TaxID=51031 RepID=W2SV11_NECAM|nr:M protein repeat protein [Necator americanus]ETN73343.1 M protein repeat protein [Necator americanus]